MTPDHWFMLAGAAGYAAFEFWLGKTNKVKSGSVLELALNLGKTAIVFAFRRRF